MANQVGPNAGNPVNPPHPSLRPAPPYAGLPERPLDTATGVTTAVGAGIALWIVLLMWVLL